MLTNLTIRYSRSTPPRKPCAWLLPGVDAAAWLDELLKWNLPDEGIELRIVPRSMADRAPLGVLATPRETPQNIAPRCLPYACLAGRLHLPVDAQISPAVTDDELSRLLTGTMSYVWHPQAGLVAFESSDVFHPSALIAPPEMTESDWGFADPGLSLHRRIRSLDAVAPPVETLLQHGRDDIGTQANQLDQLPPNPDEPKKSGISDALGAPKRGLAKFVQWMTGRAPNTAEKETWLDRLGNWANNVLNPQLQSERERELNRLMRMLEDDPDQGLKYALPMGGDPGRGIAPAGNRLTPGLVDFRLSSSSGPVDDWYVSYQIQQQLTARYRELADREVRLGRFRRAAYIYAELLGEMHSAAMALRSGRHFREAAVVYRDRLHRPREAAECLQSGGLYDEAIEIYEELNDHETVAGIHEQLNRPDQAVASYSKAVEKHRQNGDLLSAAKLLETKLDDSNEALDVLRSGWPNSTQSRQCLTEEFALLARAGQHDDAGQRIEALPKQALSSEQIQSLVTVLSCSAVDYPVPSVRDTAADTTRQVVSRELRRPQEPSRHQKQLLVDAVRKLVPEDRLLKRDCQRYMRDEPRPRPARPLRDESQHLEPVETRQLDPSVRWMVAAETNDGFYAAGYRDDELVLQSESWQAVDNPPIQRRWKIGECYGNEILLAPDPFDVNPVWIQILGSTEPRLLKKIPVTGGGHRAITAGAPPWGTADTVAIAQSGRGPTWRITEGADSAVTAFSGHGTPIFSRQFETDIEALIEPIDYSTFESEYFTNRSHPVHARSEGIHFASFYDLIQISEDETYERTRLPDRIIGLSGSLRNSTTRIAVSLPLGGVVHWSKTGAQRRFGSDLNEPKTAFTMTGKLIAADQRQIEVYDATRTNLTLEATGERSGLPIAVMPVRRSEFAILDSDGQLSLYRTNRT